MATSIRGSIASGSLNKVLGAAVILALLYFARDVLIPITLAFALCIVVSPMVRGLRRVGLAHGYSVAVSVLVLAVGLAVMALLIGTQLIRLGSSLPQYEQTLRAKVQTLDELSVGKLGVVTGYADRLVSKLGHKKPLAAAPEQLGSSLGSEHTNAPIPVEVHQPEPQPIEQLRYIIQSVAGPLEMAGVVFVVLIFVLFEQEALRDRFIRLVGGGDLRAMTVAVSDASERLSRFFISQLIVNVVVGVAIWGGLALAGLPQAFLWGVMATLLRFVPYVGIWIAAFCAALLATVITPGWSLALLTLGLFLAVELVVSQLVEPYLYGHTTGLSPLSVVLSAIFWNWIWGPVGLVLSTPLTLCLVVAGRYLQPLSFLEILFGDVPALSLPETLYQRALAGDSHGILSAAKRFLRKKPLSAYCDSVLVPAMHLAIADFSKSAITHAEQIKVNQTIASVLLGLDGQRRWWRPAPRISVLEGTTVARQLRQQRERQMGQWQGPLNVPAGSVVLGIGAGALVDELAAEVLVRVLRAQHLDGRHLALEELMNPLPLPDASPEAVAMICLVRVMSADDDQSVDAAVSGLRQRLPSAKLLVLDLANPLDASTGSQRVAIDADYTAHSYGEAIEICSSLLSVPNSIGQ